MLITIATLVAAICVRTICENLITKTFMVGKNQQSQLMHLVLRRIAESLMTKFKYMLLSTFVALIVKFCVRITFPIVWWPNWYKKFQCQVQNKLLVILYFVPGQFVEIFYFIWFETHFFHIMLEACNKVNLRKFIIESKGS